MKAAGQGKILQEKDDGSDKSGWQATRTTKAVLSMISTPTIVDLLDDDDNLVR